MRLYYHHLTARQQQFTILFLVILSSPLIGMGIDMIVPSLPTITQVFAADPTFVKLSVGIYLLGYAVMQLPIGYCMDRWGCRRLLLVVIVLYLLSTVVCMLATSIEMFLAGRLLQGVGIAGPGVALRVLLMRHFTGARLKQYTNYVGTAWAIGVIIAPLMGSYLHHWFFWQATFIYFFIHGLVLLLLALMFMPADPEHALTSPTLRCLFDMLKHRYFMAQIMLMTLAYGVMVMFHVVAPFVIQNEMHYPVTFYGQISLGLGLAWFMGTVTHRQVLKYGFSAQGLLQVCNILFFSLSLIYFVTALFPLNIIRLILPIYGMMAIVAIVYIESYANALQAFANGGGVVSALIGSMMVFGVSLVSSVASLLKANTIIPLTVCFVIMSGLIIYISVRFPPETID